MKHYFVLAVSVFAFINAERLQFDCNTLLPKSGTEQTDKDSPYTIEVSSTDLRPLQTLQVKISSSLASPFHGFIIKPKPDGNASPVVQGTYNEVPQSAKVVCNSGLTNSTDENITSLTFTWITSNTASFVFEALVLNSENGLYQNIRSEVINVETIQNWVKRTRHGPQAKVPTRHSNVKKCDVTTHCLTNFDGTFMLTWKDVLTYVEFNITYNTTETKNHWIAVGLAPDMEMGNTSVTMCKAFNNSIVFRQGYTDEYQYVELPSNVSNAILRNTSGSLANGKMTCRFQRLINTSTMSRVYPLSQSWYIEVTDGPVDGDTGVPQQHTDEPFISDDKVPLTKTTEIFHKDTA